MTKIEIQEYLWDELTDTSSQYFNPYILNSLNTCFVTGYNEDSIFQDKFTPQEVFNEMKKQLDGTNSTGGKVWAVVDEWDDTQHGRDNGFQPFVDKDGKKKTVVGLAMTYGKGSKEFMSEIVAETATKFKQDDEKKLIESRVALAMEVEPKLDFDKTGYAAELLLKREYQGMTLRDKGKTIVFELLELSGKYLLDLNIEEFILWTDKRKGKKSPMFDIAIKLLNMKVIACLNDIDRFVLRGSVSEALDGLRDPVKRLRENQEMNRASYANTN